MEPERRSGSSLVDIGVFCHEFGHVLGMPDFYDYDYSSEGLGQWSLMASGSWNNNGKTPSHFDPWCKAQLGWIEIDTVTSNLTGVPITQIETSPKAFRLWTNGQTGSEYFLVENRQKTGFDSYLVEEGLLIYHVDESVYGNDNEWCPGNPPLPHYQIALEQADGRYNLEGCYGFPTNRGDKGDPFPGYYGKWAFNNNTLPSSRDYYNDSTQVSVRVTSYSDSVMYADLYVMPNYIRGDVNRNGWIELGDIVYLISYLFRNGPAPQPLLVGDANSNGMVDIEDLVYLIDYLYRDGPPPNR